MKLTKGQRVTLLENLDQMEIKQEQLEMSVKAVREADHKYEVYKLLIPIIGDTNARWISLIL